jgi:hypothetical protein
MDGFRSDVTNETIGPFALLWKTVPRSTHVAKPQERGARTVTFGQRARNDGDIIDPLQDVIKRLDGDSPRFERRRSAGSPTSQVTKPQ